MNIIVTKDNVKIAEQSLVHKGEYNVNPLIFSFSAEYDGLSKMAVFSTLVKTYETAITNGSCIIPYEVLKDRGTLKIGVYGYTIEDDVIVKRYSPTPITIPINDGSYIPNASNPEQENPTAFEEFMQQLEGNIDDLSDDINVIGQALDDKQDKIDSDNKLPSDLVSDINQTNKFVTTEDKTNWNNKSDFSGDYNDLTNKPTIPTKVSELTNDSNYQTYEDVEDMISALGSVFTLKGTVNTVADLPMSNNKVGDVWYVKSESAGYVWINDNGVLRWERLGYTIDTSDFLTKSELLQTTGQATNNAMSQAGVTNALGTKQNTIDNSNKLSADLVNDSNTTNKFVTSVEKTTWNNKSDFTGSYNDLTNKPDLTIYEEKTDAEEKYETLLSQIPTATATGETINVQDSSNLPIKEFDLLGNATQDGTPTPDYPQNISVVTGDNTVYVGHKNIFNVTDKAESTKNGVKFKISNQTFFASGTNSSTASAWTENMQQHTNLSGVFEIGKTYTISAVGTISSGVYFAINYNNTSTGSQSGLATLNSSNNFKKTVTIPDNFGGVALVFIGISAGTTTVNSAFNVQVEIGPTQSSFEPHITPTTQLLSLGNIELAKIGTYKDEIYKDNGKWYLYKAIQKVTLNGSESWYNEGGGAPYTLNITGSIIATSNNTPPFVLCNYFQPIQYNATWTNYNSLITTSSASSGATSKIKIRYTDVANIDEFKTWLGTHNTEVRYVLATPTTTEITDTTLIGQLENVLKMHTNKNVTNAWIEPSGTNAQGGLTLTYYRDLQTITDKIDSLEARVSLLE